jgi:predicted DNA-binding transcriptional regulator YafY
MRADRLLSLVLLLQARSGASAPELAERLEVSVRTIQRDVEALSAAGVPVYTERGRHGGIRLLGSYRSGVTPLSPAEGAGLAVGQPRLAADLGVGTALESALEKIAGAGGRAVVQGRAFVLVDVDPWMRSADAVPLLPQIHDGVVSGRRLLLDYRDSEGRDQRVTADPLGLVAKAGVWYLVTAAPALLRVSRIGSCTVLAEPAARPHGADLATTWAALREKVEVRPRELSVTITVRAPARGLVHRVLAPHLQPPVPGDDTVRLSFNGVAHAVGSLLGLGTSIEVVAPPEVRSALVAAAQAIIQQYAGQIADQ